MRKISNSRLLLLAVALCCLTSKTYSQVSVYDIPLTTIEEIVVDNPKLLDSINQRIIHPDSTLGITDYFILYYGSAYLDSYAPYSESSSNREIKTLLKEEKYEEALEKSRNTIEAHPGSIAPILYLGYAYESVGDTASARKFYRKYYDLLRIPYESGDGTSADSAMIVRSVSDEYIIIDELDYSFESQALIFDEDVPFDILYLRRENDTTSYKLYFNIAQPYLLGLNFLTDLDNNKNNKADRKTKKDKKSKKDKRKSRKKAKKEAKIEEQN